MTWQTLQDTTHRIVAVEGFAGPEAMRYDPEQDVYFMAYFNGDVAGDANGFISKVEPGFLNDIAQGPDGALYVTDTGVLRIYRMAQT